MSECARTRSKHRVACARVLCAAFLFSFFEAARRWQREFNQTFYGFEGGERGNFASLRLISALVSESSGAD